MTKKNYDNYRTFDEFVKNVKIPERKWKFFENFINEQDDTFGNAVRSYHKAGWTETTTSKYRARDLYNSAMMQRLLFLYHQKTAERRENRDLSVFDRTDNDLLWAIECAKQARDYKAVESASMSRAKLHGQLVDKHQVIDHIAEQEINKTKQIEAAQVAEQRLLGEPVEPMDEVIEAAFEPVQVEECPAELSTNDIESAILGREAG